MASSARSAITALLRETQPTFLRTVSTTDSNTTCDDMQRRLLPPKGRVHHRPWMSTRWLPRENGHSSSSTSRHKPRVFDAFMFSGELELLETRLHVLSSVVDMFVFIEADVSHSGRYNRSLSFPAARGRFLKYSPKIHYKALHAGQGPHMHDCSDASRGRASAAAAMRCEHIMRGSLLTELIAAGAQRTDIVISGDVDEIPRPEYIRPFRDCTIFGPESTLETHPAVVIMLAQMWMYNIGCHTGQTRWSYGPKVGALFQFDQRRDEPWRGSNGMNFRRWGNSAESGPRWPSSAWHLTNFMTPEALALKLTGFFHFRDFTRADRDPNRLAALMSDCKSPYPTKYKRMRYEKPQLGHPSEDALAYIAQHFPSLRAREPTATPR